MLSKTFFKICAVLVRLGQHFGSCNLSFDDEHRIFKISGNLLVVRKLKINNNLIWFWALASLGIVAKFYNNGQSLRYKLTLFCWIAGISVSIVHSVMRCLVDDFCRAINAFVGLFKYLHGKS